MYNECKKGHGKNYNKVSEKKLTLQVSNEISITYSSVTLIHLLDHAKNL